MRVAVAVGLAAASGNRCTAALLLPYVETSINSVDAQCYYGVHPNNSYGNAVVTADGALCAGVGGSLAGSRIDLRCTRAGTGNVYVRAIDIEGESKGATPRWERHYNSLLRHMGGPGMSSYWTHSFSYSLQLFDAATIWVLRPDGRMFSASFPGLLNTAKPQKWITSSGTAESVYQEYDTLLQPAGWRIETPDGSVESYDTLGYLLSIKDRQGRASAMAYSSGKSEYALDASWKATTATLPAGLLIGVLNDQGQRLRLAYNSSSQLVQLTDAMGRNYRYTYDAAGNLASVIYPDGSTRRYLYNEPSFIGGGSLPNALTGITDGKGTRLASYWYGSSRQATRQQPARSDGLRCR